MIDLHCHILPGIDDGSDNMAEALELGRALVADGVSTVAATPHLNPNHPAVHVRELADGCRALTAELSRAGVQLAVVPGGEVDILWALDASPEDLRLATYGQMGRYLLVETPYGLLTGTFEQIVFDRISAKGLTAVLAHPERSPTFQREPARLAALVEGGVLVQVTAPSLVSRDRRSASRKLALWILEQGLAHGLASDSHGGNTGRPPNLTAAREVAATIDPGYADWLCNDAPAAILAGERRPTPPPRPASPRRRPWRRRSG